MSFPDYLKQTISQDFKNLIRQKLEDIKDQTEDLKNSAPNLLGAQQNIREVLDGEISRLQQTIASEIETAQNKMVADLQMALSDYVAGWYNSELPALEQRMEELSSEIMSNIPAPPKEENADLKALADLVAHLDQSRTQGEILNLLLQQIAGWVDRAILFVIKGDKANAWAALGLSGEWDTGRVKQISVDLTKENVLREVVNNGDVVYGAADQYPDNSDLFFQIGSSIPRSVLCCPVTVRGKIVGILYADLQEELSEKPDVPTLLFLACRAAGSAIDILPLKPRADVSKSVESAAGATSRGIASLGTVTAAAGVATAPPKEEVEVEESAASEQDDAQTEQETDDHQQFDVHSDTVMMPSPAMQIVTEEDRKLHDDAKRFARLLVSEIKLYNEAQVSAGRENKDLYDRLREDIERSRKMYTERVPGNIQSSTNYFYEELVRTLANGDPSLLGM